MPEWVENVTVEPPVWFLIADVETTLCERLAVAITAPEAIHVKYASQHAPSASPAALQA